MSAAFRWTNWRGTNHTPSAVLYHLTQFLNADSTLMKAPACCVMKSYFNNAVRLTKQTLTIECTNTCCKTICKYALSLISANHVSAMNHDLLSFTYSNAWNVMAQRRSLFLTDQPWHTAVVKQYPYCWDISIKVKKRRKKGGSFALTFWQL